ncbi:MAG: sugar-binding domain-containing protein, partial [Methylobacter sp.]
MKRSLIVFGFALTLLGTAWAAEPVSLAGKWRFALDRADTGVTEKWFNKDLDGDIKLPGALQNQGLGDDISTNTQWTGGSGVQQWLQPKYEKYRQPGNVKIPFFLQPEKHYVGSAWYQRNIEIPKAWQRRRVVLTLERAHWETQAWIDGKPLGINVSLSVPHVYDLGVGLTPGRHRLSICVNNRMVVDVGPRAHSVSDETQGNWNGIVGELKLSTTSPVWIDDAQVYPNIAKKTALVKVHIGNATGKPGKGMLKIGAMNQPVTWSEAGGTAELEVSLGSDAKPWDEFNPALQKLNVKLTGDSADNERELVFGLREIGVQGRQFVLNGRPTFFRGTLECAIFPLTGYPPTDVKAWKRIIR